MTISAPSGRRPTKLAWTPFTDWFPARTMLFELVGSVSRALVFSLLKKATSVSRRSCRKLYFAPTSKDWFSSGGSRLLLTLRLRDSADGLKLVP